MPFLWMILLTFVPGLELRASIPYGFFATDVPWPLVALTCVVANVIVGWIVFWLMGPVFQLFRKWRWFDTRVWPWLERRQEKLRPYVETVLDAFGTGRVMFGSDWPVCTCATNYSAWRNLVGEFISRLSENEQAQIMGGTALKAYFGG